MLDLSAFWPSPPDIPGASIIGAGFQVTPVAGRQTLVSGDVPGALAALLPGALARGPQAERDAPSYAVRLGLDRALLVEEAGPGLADGSGWHERGFAATDITDAFVVLQIEGPDASAVLSRGTGVDLDGPEPAGGGSALLKFAEVQAVVYRFGSDSFRLHVERSQTAYVWTLLETLAEVL